jgi:proprotein convertase subtilisin/kexin type 5
MQDRICKYLVLLTYLNIYIVKSCTINYAGSASCDPRCLSANCQQQFSPYHCCSGCQPYLVNYYRELSIDTTNWVGTYTSRCSEYCPPYQYEDSTGGVYVCRLCDRNCTTCSGPSNIQCKTCAPTSYQLNSTACYNQAPKSYCSLTVWNPCPDGYYGIQNTLRCEFCPTGTTRCYIAL